MGINIVIDDKVTFKVDGQEADGQGVLRPFDFTLTAIRMDTDALEEKRTTQGDQPFADFLLDVVEDWSGPRDAHGAPAPYSADALRKLLKRPGLAALCFRRYMTAVSVKEKN